MKAYILLADGFEEVEALTTADVLKRAGIETVLTSVYGEEAVRGAHDIYVDTDDYFEDPDEYDDGFSDADAVILPGGMPGTTNLKESAAVKGMLEAYLTAGKVVCAICAAPTVLGGYGMLDGKKATCFPGCESGLGGADFVGGPAVTDGNIITGKSMGCAVDFALAIVTKLHGADAAKKLEGSLHRS